MFIQFMRIKMLSSVEAFDWLALIMGSVFLLLLPIELWRYWRRGELGWPRVKEMLASISPILPATLINGAVVGLMLTMYMTASHIAVWKIPSNALTAMLVLVLMDFIYYWDHRCSHRVRGLWALYHSIHHSSIQFDQTTSLRISAIDGFFSPWFYLPLVLIGFDPLLVIASFGVILAYQTWIHTESIGKLPWLDGWLNTPANHRVHHASQVQYHDKNYSAIFMIWDRMFGSYQKEQETPIYGITHPIETANPWKIHVIEIERLWRDSKQMKHWFDRIAVWLMPPGWAPRKDS
jgi:sterol desaturase/sphingolipid hydroxylase (fatty acid hydroxylase superfamily)